jgi:hypothetical protein
VKKWEKEDIFKPTVGFERSREICNDNAISESVIVKSTLFPHRDFHKYSWSSPDGKTHSQIDVSVDKRQRSDIVEVHYFRGAGGTDWSL